MNAVLAVLIATALGTTGCMVSKTKYQEAVAESEATKTDLEKARAMKTALEQQVKSLKDLNGKLTADTELVHAELQRIRDSREKERESVEGRIRDLESKNREVVGQYRTMKQEYEELRRAHESLKVTMARYQKELKERPRSMSPPTPPAPPVPPALHSSPPAPSAGPSSMKPMMPPAPPASASAPSEVGLASVNINTASANDLVLFLGLNKDMAERVIVNRPYRLKGELVAKNILPKATFDSIRDKISVGQ
jgi:DNA uptake protein ComE-like DNA-binding protein